jgi:hypothetical protein
VEGLTGATSAPGPLSDRHILDQFDCGVEALNTWLHRRAARNEDDGASRTYVIHVGNRVMGYYSLAATSVSHAIATGKARRNMPIPFQPRCLDVWHSTRNGSAKSSESNFFKTRCCA